LPRGGNGSGGHGNRYPPANAAAKMTPKTAQSARFTLPPAVHSPIATEIDHRDSEEASGILDHGKRFPDSGERLLDHVLDGMAPTKEGVGQADALGIVRSVELLEGDRRPGRRGHPRDRSHPLPSMTLRPSGRLQWFGKVQRPRPINPLGRLPGPLPTDDYWPLAES
jgi:hypothetical protein